MRKLFCRIAVALTVRREKAGYESESGSENSK